MTEFIKEILLKYPETRDNPRLLWLAYMSLKWNLPHILGDVYPQFKELFLQERVLLPEDVVKAIDRVVNPEPMKEELPLRTKRIQFDNVHSIFMESRTVYLDDEQEMYILTPGAFKYFNKLFDLWLNDKFLRNYWEGQIYGHLMQPMSRIIKNK